MGCAAARPWAAPACRRARWCAPRCAPAPSIAVSAPDEVTGAFPVAPIPKAALVTGAARRIGRALALALAQDGFAVAIHHHNSRTEAAALADEISAGGGKA